MKTVDNSKDIIKQLVKIYDKFNEHFWGGELPDVMITFSPVKGSLGYMSGHPLWISDKGNDKYELNISAYGLNRSPKKIAEVILHEQCHIYCNLKNIKECSNGGRYHNKKFMKVAISHGLECARTETFGWSFTKFSESTEEFFETLKIKQFEYHYEYKGRSNNLMRMECPKCKDTKAWVASFQFLKCGKCNVPLEFKETEKKYFFQK